MSTNGNATFTSKAWEETPYTEMDAGRKLTRVHAVFTYEGDIEGEGTVDYLMAYGPDGVGNFVGMERIVGHIGEHAGSFVAQHTGVFDLKAVHTHWDFVPGLGTEGLEGITGSGELKLEGHGPYPFTFEYNF
jgi:Protein of unknown function (DUF3224)